MTKAIETPAGKRTIKNNIYGTIVGYIAGKRFYEFGCGQSAKDDANLFLKGYSLENILNGKAGEAEGLF